MEIKTCFRIEATLNEPIAKNKLRSNLFSTFDTLNIQDEDILSLSWGKTKSDNLYDKFIIRFASKSVLEKMTEMLKNDPHMKDCCVKSYNVEEEENFQILGSLNRSNSMSSVMTDEILIIPDNSHFSANETSFYYSRPSITELQQPKTSTNPVSEIKESESSTTIAPATNMLTSSIEESVYVAGSGHQDTDTRVEFYSNKLITDADLSVILLYIENKKASGGGDTISYELDNTRRLLTVKYERASAKKRVIEKQMHKFGDFTLNANEPFDKSKLSDPNRLVIILHGISESVEKSFVQLYTENLVVNDDEDNDVEKIERSKLLRDVVYVTFKTPIDEARIRSRVQKRPKLNNCSLTFYSAYKTNIVAVKLPQSCSNAETNGRDLVELYFSNKKRCGADPYSLVLMRDPFMYLVYNNENDCLNIVSREHKIGKYHLDVEYLHNFDLFESTEIAYLDNQEAEAASKSDSPIKQEAKQEPKSELVEVKIQKQEEPQVENEIDNLEAKIPLNMVIEEAPTSRAPPPVPKLYISIQQEPKLKIFKEMPNIWNRFELELSERQSRCEQSSEDGSIRVMCTHELPRSPVEYTTVKTKWETDILKYLSEFFLQLDICQMEIKSRDVFVELNRSIGMDSQECRMNLIDEQQLELIGLKQSVAEVRAQIEHKIAEPVEDILDGLTLSQTRMLLVKRYTRDMKIKFHDLECSVKVKELCVRYRGQPREIEEAKQKAREILASIIVQKMPVDPIVVEFFIKKEDFIVTWLKTLQYQCVAAANVDQSILEIYSTDRDQIVTFCKLIRVDLEPLTIDSSLIEMVDELKLNKFLNELYADDEIVFAETKAGIKICAFKDHKDKLYAAFLEYLPMDN